jgi:hypothetical protein
MGLPGIPRIGRIYGSGKGHLSVKSMPKGLGNDPVHMMKRFFLYRNVFGNAGGQPELGPMGSMPKTGSLLGSDSKTKPSNIGDILALASARRMGIL